MDVTGGESSVFRRMLERAVSKSRQDRRCANVREPSAQRHSIISDFSRDRMVARNGFANVRIDPFSRSASASVETDDSARGIHPSPALARCRVPAARVRRRDARSLDRLSRGASGGCIAPRTPARSTPTWRRTGSGRFSCGSSAPPCPPGAAGRRRRCASRLARWGAADAPPSSLGVAHSTTTKYVPVFPAEKKYQ